MALDRLKEMKNREMEAQGKVRAALEQKRQHQHRQLDALTEMVNEYGQLPQGQSALLLRNQGQLKRQLRQLVGHAKQELSLTELELEQARQAQLAQALDIKRLECVMARRAEQAKVAERRAEQKLMDELARRQR